MPRSRLARAILLLRTAFIVLVALSLMAWIVWSYWESPEIREYATAALAILSALTVLIAGLTWLLWKIPRRLTRIWNETLSASDLARLEEDARKTLVQLMGGLALVVGLAFSWLTVSETRKANVTTLESQRTDRLNRAIQHFAGDRVLRRGGLLELERLARDSPDDHWSIIELLTAYLRDGIQIAEPRVANRPAVKGQPHVDRYFIQDVLIVVGRRADRREPDVLDLHRLDLSRMILKKSNLRRANLSSSDLSRVEFVGIELSSADLSEAVLINANLSKANLACANLAGAKMNRAKLVGADLRAATLWSANLEGADLTDAKLERADFRNAVLNGARLGGADIGRAINVPSRGAGSNTTDDAVVGMRDEGVDRSLKGIDTFCRGIEAQKAK